MKPKQIVVFFITLTSFTLPALTQDSLTANLDTAFAFRYSIDSFFQLTTSHSFTFYYDRSTSLLERTPDAKDSAVVEKYGSLLKAKPDSNNHEQYIALAGALWKLGRIDDAEKLFRNIINSREPFYTTTAYHSSGTAYGYGSFTSNYKNSACLNLARILMEKKRFVEALQYVKDADHKYEVYYTCGTGHNWQMEEMRAYYSLCYEGGNMIDKGINYLMPYALSGHYEGLTRLLKKKYTKQQIKTNLEIAYNSIRFTRNKDSFYVFTSEQIDGEWKDKRVKSYISGKGTAILFGRKVEFPAPELEDKGVVTKKDFQTAFKASRLYRDLTEAEDGSFND